MENMSSVDIEKREINKVSGLDTSGSAYFTPVTYYTITTRILMLTFVTNTPIKNVRNNVVSL